MLKSLGKFMDGFMFGVLIILACIVVYLVGWSIFTMSAYLIHLNSMWAWLIAIATVFCFWSGFASMDDH